ncbi:MULTISPECIES: hypothetical protein [unclassified Lysinibacillus]|uniref:hypothetical protein n=1 Tax=unclassified Lysinibacillus TaxID=2636778 RepID=UPI001171A3FB|nr:hypothetical protein [Lysinibacillus sp. CD3-6]QPQ35932.1 hypothetical protein JNUCC52_03090 [Lysinibacillus sp. JNUCC-52]UED81050.1 hypothetical protein FH508_0003940 [Lysinibacillus sp. CD3-6]
MELYEQTTVFNSKLAGKAVHIKGHDVDGEEYDRVFLVKSVDGENLTLVNCQGKVIFLHMESFDSFDKEALKLKVLEAM